MNRNTAWLTLFSASLLLPGCAGLNRPDAAAVVQQSEAAMGSGDSRAFLVSPGA